MCSVFLVPVLRGRFSYLPVMDNLKLYDSEDFILISHYVERKNGAAVVTAAKEGNKGEAKRVKQK